MLTDAVDEELLALLHKSVSSHDRSALACTDTGVLDDAQFVYDNAIDVAIDSSATKTAASLIWQTMKQKDYSFKTWASHELHPKEKTEATVDFIFTMDLLNFSFWSEDACHEAFAVDYRGSRWSGYWSLVATLHRALDEGMGQDQLVMHGYDVHVYPRHIHYEARFLAKSK